jgi:hypothetical protein
MENDSNVWIGHAAQNGRLLDPEVVVCAVDTYNGTGDISILIS